MSKALYGVLGVVAVTASVAAPVTLLTGKDNKELPKKEKKPAVFKEPSWSERKMPQLNSSTDIKDKHKEFDCLKSSEMNLKMITGVGVFSFENILSQSTLSSCLIAEYYKKTYSTEDKWWGNFRFMWSLLGNNLGLIIVINVKADSEKMTSDSAIYVVNGQDNNWTTAYQQENKEETIKNKSELEGKLPKPSTTELTGSTANYWGFDPDPSKICQSNECQGEGGTESKQSLKWNWSKNGGEKKITDWCENFDDLFNQILKDQKWSSIRDKLKELKGTWTKQG